MHIQLRIQPFFWITAFLLAFLWTQGSMPQLFLAVGVIFLSVLVHEFGHASIAALFGQSSTIEFSAFGGLTIRSGQEKLKNWQEFFVIIAGPLFGFFLAVGAFVAKQYILLQTTSPLIVYSLELLIIINLFWTIVNLIPVIPLDGGQILRVVCESIFGAKGIRLASILSIVFALGTALFALIFLNPIIGLFFVMFAFQNFLLQKQLRDVSDSDGDQSVQKIFVEIETMIAANQLAQAEPKIKELLAKASSGVIHDLCVQYLAQIEYERKNFEMVVALLLPIEKHLSPTMKIILFESAYTIKDFEIVCRVGEEIFQQYPSPEIAMKVSLAQIERKNFDHAIGWLEAALKGGIENPRQIIESKEIAPLKSHPRFQDLERFFS